MAEDLWRALSPPLADIGLELVDVELSAGTVRVTVDRDGGVDLDALAAANRVVSSALDELDPLPGRYTLEVSSPGLERRLRLPAHFARAIGETVSVRTKPGAALPAAGGSARRIQGRLAASDDHGFEVVGDEVPGGSVRLSYDEVERARTVFEWGSAAAARPKGPKTPPKTTGKAMTERITTP